VVQKDAHQGVRLLQPPISKKIGRLSLKYFSTTFLNNVNTLFSDLERFQRVMTTRKKVRLIHANKTVTFERVLMSDSRDSSNNV